MMTFMPNRSAPRHPGASPPSGFLDPLAAVKEAGLGRVIERALLLDALDRQLRHCLPSALADHCRLGNVRDGTLVFLVGSPVWKAKLRLHADDLLEAARAAGLPARELVLKVATMQPAPPDAAPRLPLSRAARDALRAAAETIKDPELRAKLIALASVP